MHISSFTLKFTCLTSCCRYQPFKPHLFECIRTAALDSQTSCSGGSWSLMLTPQEPGTSNNIVKGAEAGLKSRTPTAHSDRGLFTHQWYYVHIYSDREKGVQGSKGRSGAVQSNTVTTLTHTLSGRVQGKQAQVQGGLNKETEKGVNRAQRTIGKYTSESAGVTNTGEYNTPARNSTPTRP